jgi:HEAT repeat protein
VQCDEVHIFQFLVFSVRDTVTVVKPNRRIPLVLLAVAFVVGLTALVWRCPREPRYQGISLSGWLRAYRPIGATASAASREQQAADAVRHIGTNALPFLVSWIQDYENPPPWKVRLLRYVWKLASPARESLLETISKRVLRAERAAWGFEILGEAARPAIPDLLRVADQGNPASSYLATSALAFLGKDGLLPLLALMTNSPSMLGKEATMSAVRSLSQTQYLGTNAHPAVVLLIKYLSDPLLAPSAAEVLGSLGLESDIIVPALAECTHSDNPELQIAAATSLARFGASARPAVPELLKMLDDPSASVRDEATNALQQIAPEALSKTEPH